MPAKMSHCRAEGCLLSRSANAAFDRCCCLHALPWYAFGINGPP
jgi:hypothetical protein